MHLAYNIVLYLTIAHIRAIFMTEEKEAMCMIIVTTIDVSVEVYRHFLHRSEMDKEITPEELMVQVLSEYVEREERLTAANTETKNIM